MHKGLKNFLDDRGYTVLEYMGITRHYFETVSEVGYKDFRQLVENDIISTQPYRTIYYWMVRNRHGHIEYIGHDGIDIRILGRGNATYIPGMYEEIEDGVIAPLANGHNVHENCWDNVAALIWWE